jgi:hypothetical protein
MSGECRHGNEDYVSCEICQRLMKMGSYPLIGYEKNRWEHDLKILPEYLGDVVSQRKRFEIRRNDREFHEGDLLRLLEWDNGRFTGKSVSRQVDYITDYEQKPGFVVMSLGAWLYLVRRP